MNCQESRRFLHPYLDDEVGVDERLTIEGHLEECAPCQALFDDEKRCWSHFQSSLRSESAPASLLSGIEASLTQEDRRQSRRRLLRFAPPLAAAAAIVIALAITGFGSSDDGGGGGGGGHPHHGRGIELALTAHKEHVAGLTLKGLDVLERNGAKIEKLTGSRFREFCKSFFGDDAESKLPEAFRDAVAATIPDDLTFEGTPVSNLILDATDVEVSIYRMSRKQAELANLHLHEEEGIPSEITIQTCAACRVVAVTKGDEVVILVTEEGDISPLIALARQTY